MNNTYQIYLISDSTGETLDRIFLALKAQFKNFNYKTHQCSFTRTENINYTNFEKISQEIEAAKKTFKKYKWPVIDVTRKSVEETAASVIKIYEISKENV